jgi:hypothetical protein
VALLLVTTAYTLLTQVQDFDENRPVQLVLAAVVVGSLLAFVRQNTKLRR